MKTINIEFEGFDNLGEEIKKLPKKKEILALIFSGVVDYLFLEELRVFLTSKIKNVKILGTTTDGEIINGKVIERKTVISFNIFDKTEVKTKIEMYKGNLEKSGENLAKSLIEKNSKLLLIFADGLKTNGDALLRGVNRVNKNIIVAGGLAGDNKNFINTYVMNEQGVVKNGCVGATLNSDDLIVHNDYLFGWEGIGKEFTVTKAEENKIYEIDNKNIFEIYKKYLGEHVIERLPNIAVEVPFVVQKEIKYSRACIGKRKDHLIYAGELQNGDKVKFGIGDREKIAQKEKKLLKRVSNKPIESIFIFSCMARKNVLKTDAQKEVYNLSKYGKSAGFFTYGEFFHRNHKHWLFNETFTFITLSENEKTPIKFEFLIENEETECDIIKKSLITFINTTTKELEELNKNLEKRVKEEVEKNIAQEKILFLQHKQAQMGEMLSMIAHQWRQPLNTLSTTCAYIDLLTDQEEINREEIKAATEKAEKNILNMSQIIDDFIEFAKPNHTKNIFNVKEAILNALEIAKAQLIKKGIKVHTKLHSCGVYGNKSLLEQTVLNLIINARDAYEKKNSSERHIYIRNYLKDNYCTIEVEDEAGGIPKEIQDRIFEPYFTSKGPVGTGLGLYMSKLIIEKEFNGKIEFENTEKGAKFMIEIKVAEDDTET